MNTDELRETIRYWEQYRKDGQAKETEGRYQVRLADDSLRVYRQALADAEEGGDQAKG